MEAQERAKRHVLTPILTLAYQKKRTTVSQTLGLVFQQHVPAESSVRLDGMSAMEQPLRPTKTFEEAIATLKSWQSRLRVVLREWNARPEPLRPFNSVLALIGSLTHHDADFSYSVSFLTRSTRVRTLENFLAVLVGRNGVSIRFEVYPGAREEEETAKTTF